MKKNALYFTIILAIFLIFGHCSCSQEQGVESVKYGSIQGKVLYSNGSDHSGITVTLDRTDGLRVIGGEDGSKSIVSMVSTARDGSFSFQNLEPGTYTVYASSNDSVEKAVSTNVVVEGSKAVTTDDLRLTVTGSISGYVLMDGQTTGNMGFVVFLAGTSYVAVTDDTGYYCISGVPAGKGYKLAVSKGSYTCSDVVLCTVTAHGTTNVMVRNISSADLESGTGTLIWKGSFATAPANPGLSWAYYNTSDKCFYVYNGIRWVLLVSNDAGNGSNGNSNGNSEESTLIVKPAEGATFNLNGRLQFVLLQEFNAYESIEFLARFSDDVTGITVRQGWGDNIKFINNVNLTDLECDEDGWYVISVPASSVLPSESGYLVDTWIGLGILAYIEDTENCFVEIKNLTINGMPVDFSECDEESYVSTYYDIPNHLDVVFNGVSHTVTPVVETIVINKMGTVSDNLIYNGNFELGSDTDLMEDGSVIEVVSGAGIYGSNAMAVTQTATYGEVVLDITDYYGRGKSYYVEASYKNIGGEGTRTEDLTAYLGFYIVTGAGYDATGNNYDVPGEYDGYWLSNEEAEEIFEIETNIDSYGEDISDGEWHIVSAVLDAETVEAVMKREDELNHGTGDPTMYQFGLYLCVGTYPYQDGYKYLLDNIVFKDLNSEIPRQGRTYQLNEEPEEPEEPEPVSYYNYVTFDAQGGSSVSSEYIESGSKAWVPPSPSKSGYSFAGWYRDQNCTLPYDFNQSVYYNFTLYAKWVEDEIELIDGPIYHLVATHGVDEGIYDYDKFVIKFGDVLVNPGDVLSFRYRSTVPFSYFSIRGDKKWVYEQDASAFTSYSVQENGWTYVTFEFPECYYDGSPVLADAWFRIDFGSSMIVVGDILEIQGISINEEPLVITDGNVQSYVNPSVEVVDNYEWTGHYVTFDSGSDVQTVFVDFGGRIAEPESPIREGYFFYGWYLDPEFTVKYNFDTLVIEDLLLYARWFDSMYSLTLDSNYEGAPEPTILAVPGEIAIDAPRSPSRVGYYFDGWYREEACENEFDFSEGIYEDTTIYAKWNDIDAYIYKCTSTVEATRWQFRWHEDTVEMFNGTIQPGDVFTLMLKFDDANTLAEDYFRLRTRNGEKHITENVNFSSTEKTEDGWYLITVNVPDAIENGSGLYLQVSGEGEANWPVGSIMYIKGFAYNGTEIEIDARPYGTASTRWGAYSKVCADIEVIHIP